MKNIFLLLIAILALLMPAGISSAQTASEIITTLPKINNTAWLYNAEDDVYYQIGIPYCETPADETYENLAVFVPGAYMSAVSNGDNTYTCRINSNAAVGKYTAATAPVVIPVNTPGYSAMAPLTEYTSLTSFMDAGFIYVHAGCRGRNHGAPAGITDLKAAIRYIRFSADMLPGNTEAIFSFGMSGGGAQSALLGSTGDNELYEPYLQAIGAVQGVSDAVLGSMCWCPITDFISADEAYEWMMGVTRVGLTDEEQAISDNLAAAFASYINEAGLRDPEGNLLTLEASANGIYQEGSYYDYILKVIERSLNNFLVDTEFPYDASAASSGGPGGGFPGGGRPDGGMPEGFPGGNGSAMDGDLNHEGNFEAMDDISRNQTNSGVILDGVYETVQDYINALNTYSEWVTYDPVTMHASVSSAADFVMAFKTASKKIGAFDQMDGGQGENILFGYGDGKGAHFDETLTDILVGLGSEYAEAFVEDMTKPDSLGNTVDMRLNMYTPLYYLLESEEGYGSSSVAKYWRIRTGIFQSDCALSTEVNLSLALKNYEGVENVDFDTVWGQGHVKAERIGDSTDNFITWVNRCMSHFQQ